MKLIRKTELNAGSQPAAQQANQSRRFGLHKRWVTAETTTSKGAEEKSICCSDDCQPTRSHQFRGVTVHIDTRSFRENASQGMPELNAGSQTARNDKTTGIPVTVHVSSLIIHI